MMCNKDYSLSFSPTVPRITTVKEHRKTCKENHAHAHAHANFMAPTRNHCHIWQHSHLRTVFNYELMIITHTQRYTHTHT
jgi:hypothetical protein